MSFSYLLYQQKQNIIIDRLNHKSEDFLGINYLKLLAYLFHIDHPFFHSRVVFLCFEFWDFILESDFNNLCMTF